MSAALLHGDGSSGREKLAAERVSGKFRVEV